MSMTAVLAAAIHVHKTYSILQKYLITIRTLYVYLLILSSLQQCEENVNIVFNCRLRNDST